MNDTRAPMAALRRVLPLVVLGAGSWVALEASVALAAVWCGFVWGTVVVAAVGVILGAVVLHSPVYASSDSVTARWRRVLHDWAIARGEHSHGLVRRAQQVGAVFGFVVSSIVLGPLITSVVIARGTSTRRFWFVIVLSSVLFAVVWVGGYAGLWQVFGGSNHARVR